MSKLRIAILATELKRPHPAGSQMLEVINYLSDEFDFHVFAATIDDKIKDKVNFHKVNIPLFRPLLLRYIVQFFLFKRLISKYKLLNKFDLVHSIEVTSPFAHIVTMQFCGCSYAKLLQNKIVRYDGFRSIYYPILNFYGTKFEKNLMSNPYLKTVVAVSGGLKNDLECCYGLKSIQVIPNAVDFGNTSEYNFSHAALNNNTNLIIGIIVAIGDWQRKGLDLLIKAVSLLKNKENLKIMIIGKGPIDKYKNLCKKMNVSENFDFLGFQNNLEFYYRSAHFFIFPSAFEAFPIVILEALYFGLPIVSTKINGVDEVLVNEYNGLIIERNVIDISEKLQRIIDEPQLLKQLADRVHFDKSLYSIENISLNYKTLYYNSINYESNNMSNL
jgi:glycosyltransferase involved in cell wall biosynthesis